MNIEIPSADDFEDIAFKTMRQRRSYKKNVGYSGRRFRSWFGTDPLIVHLIWKILYESCWLFKAYSVKPIHLLWSLHFLKNYETESENASIYGCVDEKTVRKWVWFYVQGISELASKVVSNLKP